MIKDKKVLGIIPARSGSKDLPRKNILPLAGKPLIVWTIEAAAGSKYIDRFIVSTDCEEIAIGDINVDGQINVIDVVLIVNCILGSNCDECSDLNEDGTSNIVDIIVLVNIILNPEYPETAIDIDGGVYFGKMRVGDFNHTQKLMLIK